MSHSGSTISAPVQILGDLCPVLGTSRTGLGDIITHADIAKWNKNKPVSYPKITSLTDAERKGTAADNNAGIFYGLKIATQSSLDWLNLHSLITFNYIRPTDYFRLLDFRGYNHAQGCPCSSGLASGTLEGYTDIEDGLDVTIVQSGNSDTEPSDAKGIDAAWLCNASKAQVYPVVVMTYNGTSYATCLRNSNKGNKSTPLWYQNARQDNFHISFEGYPDKPSGITSRTCTMSIGFVVASSAPNAFNVQSGETPTWQAIPSTGFAQRFFGLNNAVGRAINLRSYDNTPTPIIDSVNVIGSRANTSYHLESYPTGTFYVRLWVELSQGGVQRGSIRGGVVLARRETGAYITPSADLVEALFERPLTQTTYNVMAIVEIGTSKSPFVTKRSSARYDFTWTYTP